MTGNDQLDDDHVDLTGVIIAGKYQILDFVAKGGGGTIYRAVQLQIGRDVVLKILHPHPELFETDPHFATRFRREAATYGKLRHPNTVTLFDYGEHEHHNAILYFMALEYVRGRTLRQVLRQEIRLTSERATALTQEILRSLREAHKLGIVHRDLKPSNVMLVDTEEGERVKVLDFGVAKVALTEDTSADLTRTGTVIGSPHYMAPEQIRSLRVDGRTDIYALGCILFELLTGIPPFNADSVIEICAAHLSKPAPTLVSRGASGASVELEAIVAKCLEKEPDDRFQSVDELLAVLKAFRHGTDPVSIERSFVSLRLPFLEPKTKRMHPTVWIAVGILMTVTPAAVFVGSVLVGLYWMQPAAEVADKPVPDRVVEESPAPSLLTPALPAQTYELTSEPPGAEVSCGGRALGKTPFTLEAPACSPLLFKLAGYREVTLPLDALEREPDKVVTLSRLPRQGPKPEPFKPDVRTER